MDFADSGADEQHLIVSPTARQRFRLAVVELLEYLSSSEGPKDDVATVV